MTRAEEAALKAYPKRKDGRKRYYNCTDDDVPRIYAQGYRKAEKDTIKRAVEWWRPRLQGILSPGLVDGIIEEFRNGMK